MSVLTWIVVALVVLAVVVAVVSCVGRARRLDRLHVRVDAARAGLDGALQRRADVAAALAGELAAAGQDAAPVRAALEARAGAPSSEAAENALTRALAAIDRKVLGVAVRAELSDAEHLVYIARRVHNDAVRDTLGLRSRRLVRWLRLAGTAPVPAYFEIADPYESRPGRRVDTGATPGDPGH